MHQAFGLALVNGKSCRKSVRVRPPTSRRQRALLVSKKQRGQIAQHSNAKRREASDQEINTKSVLKIQQMVWQAGHDWPGLLLPGYNSRKLRDRHLVGHNATDDPLNERSKTPSEENRADAGQGRTGDFQDLFESFEGHILASIRGVR